MRTSTLKIIDFSDERETKGTPSHMSPELILNLYEMPGFRSDVYSAGVVFWEMLSLENPFAGYRSPQVLQFHRENRMLQLNDEWPDSLKEILRQCLNADARQRPSFEQIVENLERIREEFPYYDEAEEYVEDEEEHDGVDYENETEEEDEEDDNEEVNNEKDDNLHNDNDNNDSSSNLPQADGAPIPSSLFSI